MKKISSSNYPLTRLLHPFIELVRRPVVLGGMALVLLGIVGVGLWILLLPLAVPILLLIAIHHAPYLVLQNFCEDVWFDEEARQFIARRKSKTWTIPFTQVHDLTWHPSGNPPRVKIHVKQGIAPGTIFTFIPELAHGRQKAQVMIAELKTELLRQRED
jgi:hypothetical protein